MRGSRRRKTERVALAVFAAFALHVETAAALDPGHPASQYVMQSWDTDQGLPTSSVFAVAQTSDSYLWLATAEGLVRFDGAQFRVFDRRNTPSMGQHDVRALFADGRSLWIGTRRGGLLRYTDGQFTSFTRDDGLPSDFVLSLAGDRRGTVWIGTSAGLARYTGGRLHVVSKADGLLNDQVATILVDPNGDVWVGTDGGLNRLHDGRVVQSITKKDGLPDDVVTGLLRLADGAMWIATRSGLGRMKDGRIETFGTKDGLSDDDVVNLASDRDGNLWIGTRGGGLNRYARGAFSSFTTKEGLPTDVILSAHEDHEGNLWVGTDGKGVIRLKDRNVTPYTTENGLARDFAWSVFEDSKGAMWIGTQGGGVSRWDGRSFTTLTVKDGLPSNYVYGTCEDTAGALWIGTEGGGVARIDGSRVTALASKDGLTGDNGRVLYADRDGSVWVAFDRGGLDRIEGGAIEHLSEKDGIPDLRVTAFLRDRSGALWIGTAGGGLVKKRDGATQVYTTREGLSQNNVSALYEDKDGALWIGTIGGGIDRLNAGRIDAFLTKDGLFDDAVYSILEDDHENLWTSCNRGISRVRKKDLDDFAEKRVTSFSSRSFGKGDGMKNPECNSGSPAGSKTRDGRLWFPTMHGVVVIDPEHVKENAVPPPLAIEDMIVNRRTVTPAADSKEDLVLSPDSRDFEFHYAALSFSAPERVRYRYRLEGFDGDWIDAGARRAAYYTNLPAGDYRFRVIAANEDGLWNDDGVAIAFRLTPYYYRTAWFYGLVGLTLALGGSLGYRARVKTLKDAAEVLDAKVRERTLELTLANARLADANRQLAERDERLSEDLARAQAFQQRVLRASPTSERVVFATSYKPAEVVGGDLYDVCEHAPGRFRIFLADATGHGVQASLRTMVLITEYDRVKLDAADPGAALARLNAALYAVYPGLEMRCSACCFDIEPHDGGGATVRYANAAHPPILHVTPAAVHEVYRPGPFLGMIESIALQVHTFEMAKGDRLLAYTDGICEQDDARGDSFGVDRVGRGIARRDIDLQRAVDALYDDLVSFAGARPIADDVALVAAELRA